MAKTIVWKNTVGQDRVKEVLAKAYAGGTLGHAYLLSGEVGSGKFQVAIEFAMALHCESEDAAPCGVCTSCHKIVTNGDPDLRIVFPISLAAADKEKGGKGGIGEGGWERISSEIVARIADPYLLTDSALANIPVDWIRESSRGIMRGSITGKTNITIICDVDTMSKETANAMLKTLEEPPANTLFLLLTSRPASVLPTIKSRCQILRFGAVDIGTIEEALAREFSQSTSDDQIRIAAASSLGYYGRARDLYTADDRSDQFIYQTKLLRACKGAKFNLELTGLLDEIQSVVFAPDGGRQSALEFFSNFIHIIRSIFFKMETGTENYIYRKCFGSGGDFTLRFDTAAALAHECEKAVSDIEARALPQMVLISFAMSLMEKLNGEK